jgi:hypothetical protein
MPSNSALKYSMVPPTSSGRRAARADLGHQPLASCTNSAAL